MLTEPPSAHFKVRKLAAPKMRFGRYRGGSRKEKRAWVFVGVLISSHIVNGGVSLRCGCFSICKKRDSLQH